VDDESLGLEQVVYQVRYSWSDASLLGTRGMGPVESTLPVALLPLWDQHLRDHVWAANDYPGFTFFVRHSFGALLRKTRTAAADGRPGSTAHALISSELTAPIALGLTCWDGWDTPVLNAVSWPEMESVAGQYLDSLRSYARRLQPARLASLFAQILHAPRDGYTVIGDFEPLATICALGDLLGETPTFASDETSDGGTHQPVAIFLREPSFSSTTVTRRRLDPAAPADPVVSAFATGVVDAYAADGLQGIAVLRRAKPPTNLAEARAWATATQFAPGVIADLTRLPKLDHNILTRLADDVDALQRIRSAAEEASPADLADALDTSLPQPVSTAIIPAAVSAVTAMPAESTVLARLAQFHPITLDLVHSRLPTDIDLLAHMSQMLLSPRDRQSVLARATRDMTLDKIILWIEVNVARDPDGARAAYKGLCARADELSPDDVRALVGGTGLVDAVRRFSESEPHASTHLVTLLRALPDGTLTAEVVADLGASSDPLVLHALDSTVTDETALAAVHQRIRLAYYYEHALQEPLRPPLQHHEANPGGFWKWLLRFGRPADGHPAKK